MQSVTKIYKSGEEEKSIGEAILLCLFDIAVASTLGIAADVLAAAITITEAASGDAVSDKVKVNSVASKGDSVIMVKSKQDKINTNFVSIKVREERSCTKRVSSRRF